MKQRGILHKSKNFGYPFCRYKHSNSEIQKQTLESG